jgi:hypothetical protein
MLNATRRSAPPRTRAFAHLMAGRRVGQFMIAMSVHRFVVQSHSVHGFGDLGDGCCHAGRDLSSAGDRT